MKGQRVLMATVFILLIASMAIAAEPVPVDDPPDRLVQGTILTISRVTGDLMLGQDEGTVLVLNGIDPAILKALGAGDRITVRLGANFEVREVARLDTVPDL